jgi:hypothetical protein
MILWDPQTRILSSRVRDFNKSNGLVPVEFIGGGKRRRKGIPREWCFRLPRISANEVKPAGRALVSTVIAEIKIEKVH